MRSLIVLGAVCAFLLAPAGASGGGWATVGFEPLPDGVAAGATWAPTIVIKQHGVRPLSGLQPVVTIREAKTGATRAFTAVAGDAAGSYRAEVVFPSEGSWHVRIESGFGDSHVTYGPVAVGAETAPPAEPGSFPTAGVLAAALAALAAAAALLGARRLRGLSPAGR
ncbi:MAG TPA: hypothetical protein VNJ53_00110 [Gaiellaceae bacterium]|nr:hypothetical protein [Gaiellaceae bacterium]